MLMVIMSACHNGDWEFPDYDYQTVYFAYQYPVRTITLGEDIFDTTLDNEHKCKIVATTGGVYSNNEDVLIGIEVDESLCDGIGFSIDEKITPMPQNYYSLADNQIIIPKGELTGAVEVQLTDAFFADSFSIKNTYVIPLIMKNVENADSILSGEPATDSPKLNSSEDWTIAPKNFTLFAVKYVNPWHGAYLRRGVDVGVGKDGNTQLDTTIIYHEEFVIDDQVVNMNTISMNEVVMSLKTNDKNQATNLPFELYIRIDDEGNCTVSSLDSDEYVVSGNGKVVEKGDSWGGEARDVMYLDYTVDFAESTHVFTDTLVLRDRQVGFETFTPLIQ